LTTIEKVIDIKHKKMYFYMPWILSRCFSAGWKYIYFLDLFDQALSEFGYHFLLI